MIFKVPSIPKILWFCDLRKRRKMVKHDQKVREFWKSSCNDVLMASLEIISSQCKRHYKWHCNDTWAVLQCHWQWILLSLGKNLKCCCSCVRNFQPLISLRGAGWNFQQIKYFNGLAADEAAAVCIVIRILSWYMRHFYCMRWKSSFDSTHNSNLFRINKQCFSMESTPSSILDLPNHTIVSNWDLDMRAHLTAA